MSFRPTNDRVVLKIAAAVEKYRGSILIPETVAERSPEGTVVAVGPGAINDDGVCIPLTVKPGDNVVFIKNSGSTIKIDGEEFYILQEVHILGILE